MASGPEILIRYLADYKQLEQGSDKVQKTGSKFSSFAKVAGGALAGIGIASFFKSSIKGAEESQVATHRLEQVFKSMGDTTGEAAKHAEDYASALMKKTGIDDEVIMGSQAILATFGKVSDATARGAGIFDRATGAAADLAAAGFGSMDANAKMLGKALNDPIKGMTALAKSGVTFTDAQKEQIKGMVKSHNLLGAQKLILGEVEKQVGGTAEATATSSQKMQAAFGEIQEEVGSHLLPVMSILTDLFARYGTILIPIVATVAALLIATKAYQVGVKAVAAAQAIWNGIQIAFNIIMAANPILLVVIGIIALVAAIVIAYKKVDWFRKAVDKMARVAKKGFSAVVDAAKTVFTWIKRNWPLLLAILLGPIGVATALIIKNWDKVSDAAKALFRAVSGAFSSIARVVRSLVSGVVSFVTGAWSKMVSILSGAMSKLTGLIQRGFGIIKGAVSAIVGFIRRNWQTLVAILVGPIGVAVLLIRRHFDTIKRIAAAVVTFVVGRFQSLGRWLTAIVSNVVNFVVNYFRNLLRALSSIASGITSFVVDRFRSIYNWLSSIASRIVSFVVDRFRSMQSWLSRIVSSIGSVMSSLARVFRIPMDAAAAVVRWIADRFNDLVNFFRGLPGRIGGAVSSLANAFRGPLNAIIRGLNALQFTIPRVEISLPFGKSLGAGPWTIDLIPWNIPELAQGGTVTRGGLAMLHPAEVVTPLAQQNTNATNVYVTVNVPPSSSPVDVGRAIVDAIRKYENVAGVGWRRAPSGRTA